MIYKCKHFGIKEIVSKNAYNFFIVKKKYSEDFLWSMFEEEILKDLDDIRDAWAKYLKEKYPTLTLSASIIINNWYIGGDLSQCGLRCNADPLVKSKSAVNQPYLSAHCLAKGFDLHPANARYLEFWKFVCNFISAGKTRKLKRVENFKHTPTWCHTDAFRTADNKLYIFDI